MHGLGPPAGRRTKQTVSIQQIIDATFNDLTFAAVQVCQSGGELARFGQRV